MDADFEEEDVYDRGKHQKRYPPIKSKSQLKNPISQNLEFSQMKNQPLPFISPNLLNDISFGNKGKVPEQLEAL